MNSKSEIRRKSGSGWSRRLIRPQEIKQKMEIEHKEGDYCERDIE